MPGGGGQGVRGGGAGCGSAVQAGCPFCAGDQPCGRGRGQEQPALPRSAGLERCPGDMMIDWVSPPCGDAAARSNQAVRAALREQARQRLTAVRRELAAVVPIG
jgi:hypothetical protein